MYLLNCHDVLLFFKQNIWREKKGDLKIPVNLLCVIVCVYVVGGTRGLMTENGTLITSTA